MIEVKDRIPTYPGRVKLVPVEGQENVYDMVRVDSPTEEGTPINKALFDSIRRHLETGVYANNTMHGSGEIWTSVDLPSSGQWVNPAYGNGVYVTAKYDSAEAAYSMDGITWASVDLPISGQWVGCTYGNGRFVLVGNTTSTSHACVATSTDGISWPVNGTGYIGTVANWIGPIFDGTRFIVIGCDDGSGAETSAHYTSTNGTAWTEGGGNFSSGLWCDIAISDNTMATVSKGSSEVAFTTSTGWYTSEIGVNGDWSRILYGNAVWAIFSKANTYYAYSADIYSSFSLGIFPDNIACGYFEFGSGVFVAAPYNGSTVLISGDCVTWDEVELPVGDFWGGLKYSNGTFTLLSSDGARALVSRDGKEWAEKPTNTSIKNYDLYDVNDRLFVFPRSGDTALFSEASDTSFSSYTGESILLFASQIKDLPIGAKCAYGSYTGKGAARLDWQNYLSFDFKPVFGVIVGTNTAGNLSCAVFSPSESISFFGTGNSDPKTTASTISAAELTVSRDGNTIMWKSMLDDLDSAKKAQCNVSDIIYHYVFFG